MSFNLESNTVGIEFADKYLTLRHFGGLFKKKVEFESRISYRNIDYLEYEEQVKGWDKRKYIYITIGLINPQPEFNTTTLPIEIESTYFTEKDYLKQLEEYSKIINKD